MERSSKRGKIPQSDWPLIMARYEAGETLASIARTYGCSPPAISYVVSRSRARQNGAEAVLVTTEPQLIKSGPHNGSTTAEQQASPQTVTTPASPPSEQSGLHKPNGDRASGEIASRALSTNPTPTNPPPALPPGGEAPRQITGNGDARRTLHLSLGGNASHANGGAYPNGGSQPNGRPHYPEPRPAESRPSERLPHSAPAVSPIAQRPAMSGLPEVTSPIHPAAFERSEPERTARKENGGSYIDRDLRARVDDDIAAFLAAFDAALVQDSQESRSALREATDRLLRAGARTRIELERLEARIPLAPRDSGGRSEHAWRPR